MHYFAVPILFIYEADFFAALLAAHIYFGRFALVCLILSVACIPFRLRRCHIVEPLAASTICISFYLHRSKQWKLTWLKAPKDILHNNVGRAACMALIKDKMLRQKQQQDTDIPPNKCGNVEQHMILSNV